MRSTQPRCVPVLSDCGQPAACGLDSIDGKPGGRCNLASGDLRTETRPKALSCLVHLGRYGRRTRRCLSGFFSAGWGSPDMHDAGQNGRQNQQGRGPVRPLFCNNSFEWVALGRHLPSRIKRLFMLWIDVSRGSTLGFERVWTTLSNQGGVERRHCPCACSLGKRVLCCLVHQVESMHPYAASMQCTALYLTRPNHQHNQTQAAPAAGIRHRQATGARKGYDSMLLVRVQATVPPSDRP